MSEEPKDNGVSSRALYIAKMIDLLLPGTYTIILVRPDAKQEDWNVNIYAAMKIQEREVAERKV